MPRDNSYTRPQRAAELLVVATVSAWVADRGEVSDRGDGHDPDFWIDYRDGRTAVGEVGLDQDPQLAAMWAAIFAQEQHQIIDLAAGFGQWGVSLDKGANIGQLYKGLPGLIQRLLALGSDHLDIVGSFPRGELPDQARVLGISYLNRVSDGPPDRAVFFPPASGGMVPTESNPIVDWLDDNVVRYKDSTSKLLPIDAGERHVFFVAGSRTPFGVQELFRRLDTSGLPTKAPQLPRGISHLWGAGTWGGASAVLWHNGRWSSVPLTNAG